MARICIKWLDPSLWEDEKAELRTEFAPQNNWRLLAYVSHPSSLEYVSNFRQILTAHKLMLMHWKTKHAIDLTVHHIPHYCAETQSTGPCKNWVPCTSRSLPPQLTNLTKSPHWMFEGSSVGTFIVLTKWGIRRRRSTWSERDGVQPSLEWQGSQLPAEDAPPPPSRYPTNPLPTYKHRKNCECCPVSQLIVR